MVVKADCSDTSYIIPVKPTGCVDGGLDQTKPAYIIVTDYEEIVAGEYV